MWSLLERGKKIIFALVLSIIPLALLYVQSKDAQIRERFTKPMLEVSGFFEQGALTFTGFISDFLYKYFFLASRSDELRHLRAEVLKVKALEARVLDLLNERASIMDLQYKAGEAMLDQGVLARVIARAGAPMARIVRLDKGFDDGIKPKSPVIAHDGVVGQVLNVSAHFCDVLLITDASFAIDAKIVGSNARGLLRGTTKISQYMMEIRDIDGISDLKIGDIVVSSGLNSNFPAGIPIGSVIETSRSRDNLYISARIEPFVLVDRLNHVMVLDGSSQKSSGIEALNAAWPLAVQ